MTRLAFFCVLSLAAAIGSARAQPPPSAPAAATAPSPAGTPTDPNLAVATVKLQDGIRLSKLIGSAVYNDQNEKIGTIDDLFMKDGNRVFMAIVSVGGFLGIGDKLVAIPYDQLRVNMTNNETKIALPGITKDSLNAMPTFTYRG